MSYMSEAEVNARVLAEGPAEPTPSVFIMGAGVVGTALAARLVRAGLPVIGLHGRQVDLSDAARAISGVVGSTGDIPDIISESDVVIISVRDERIPEVAAAAGAREAAAARADPAAHLGRQPGAHDSCAGACRYVRASGRCTRWCRSPTRASRSRAWTTSRSASRATSRRARWPSASCARWARAAVFLEAENLALYHAGAVMASNYVVALADTAQTLLVRAGVPPEQALPVLIPLLNSVVQNLARLGLARGADRAGRAGRRVVGRAAPEDAGGARAGAAGAVPAGRP